MSRYTPGPWHLWDHEGSDFTAISNRAKQEGDDTLELDDEVLGSSEWLRVSKADLTLMAAAPELLEALEDALVFDAIGESSEGGYLSSYARDKIKTLIKKAKGL